MSTKQTSTVATPTQKIDSIILVNSNGAELEVSPTRCTINGIEFNGKICKSQTEGKVYISSNGKQPSFYVGDANNQLIIDKYNANIAIAKATNKNKVSVKKDLVEYASVDEMLDDKNAPSSVAVMRDKVNARKVSKDVYTLAIDNQIKALQGEKNRMLDLWDEANAKTDAEFNADLDALLASVNEEIKRDKALEKIKHMSAKEMRVVLASLI